MGTELTMNLNTQAELRRPDFDQSICRRER